MASPKIEEKADASVTATKLASSKDLEANKATATKKPRSSIAVYLAWTFLTLLIIPGYLMTFKLVCPSTFGTWRPAFQFYAVAWMSVCNTAIITRLTKDKGLLRVIALGVVFVGTFLLVGVATSTEVHVVPQAVVAKWNGAVEHIRGQCPA